MRQTLLTNDQLLHLQKEKTVLNEAVNLLSAFALPREALDALENAARQLDELFLLVVVGEFNSGKSALINALLGERILREGVTPTTARVTLVRWGEKPGEQIVDDGFAIFTYPLDLLKEINIVDSPGTNAIIRQHEILTNEYVPRSDLVLFTTSADRPLTESERLFLEKILSWGKKIVLVVNKADILENQEAVEEVRSFVSRHTAGILGAEPELFVVSARLGQKALLAENADQKAALRAESGMEALETYITRTLDDRARLGLKLNSPLGVAENVLRMAQSLNREQAKELEADTRLVADLEGMLGAYDKALQSEIVPRLAEVENVLQRFEARGQDFFDSTLRLTNIGNLAKSEKIKAKFEQEVLAEVPQEIEEKVRAMIDWLVDKDLNVWYQVMAALERRQAADRANLNGSHLSAQAERRKDLMESVGQTIRGIVNSYNRKKEAEELSAFVEGAVAQTALFEVGAVGLGALVATALFSSAMDVTGIVAAGTLAILGLFVIPYKRKQVKQSFKEKMEELRANLMNTLSATFRRESELAIRRLNGKISPYTAEVRADQEKISSDASSLSALETLLKETRDAITKVL
ncbi:MAG: dynamin [Chloroflexi bacterium]|jgi:small GTP-binding protein|nr:dynamin family protein [Anaerolineaceae bacterium]NLI44286.1 dynamin [Chloroflexota bacterium]HOE34706.1 dynamin family protein [Anaerolineaceae bacterium]HOT25745.1 dynamin family protein [Anaerolineaceae bacterium]HQH57980.1 dynamin family protein [Anaerolineaceae bacterium]